MTTVPRGLVAERHHATLFVHLDWRDGPLDPSTIQLVGPPLIGVHAGSTIVRDRAGSALLMVEPGGFRILIYRAPAMPETMLLGLTGRPLANLLEGRLITCAGLRSDAVIEYIGRHTTPWDGPHARLAERVVPTLEVDFGAGVPT